MMSRQRIFREELDRAVSEAIELRAATVAFSCNRLDAAKAVYGESSSLTEAIVERLLRDYSVVRKPRTERVV